MNVQHVTPILNVSNLLESFAWCEKLGWRKTGITVIHRRSARWLRGLRDLSLRGLSGSPWRPLPREAWDNQAGSTWMTWLMASPAEVDTAHAFALELGLIAPWPPTDMPWNVRECHIRYPDGHTFRVSARIADE